MYNLYLRYMIFFVKEHFRVHKQNVFNHIKLCLSLFLFLLCFLCCFPISQMLITLVKSSQKTFDFFWVLGQRERWCPSLNGSNTNLVRGAWCSLAQGNFVHDENRTQIFPLNKSFSPHVNVAGLFINPTG